MTISERILKLIPADKLLHLVIAYGCSLTLGMWIWWLAPIVGVLLCSLKEGIDKAQYGLWDWKDWAWGMVGTLLATALCLTKWLLFYDKIQEQCKSLINNNFLFYA